jgi:hypothetical protein
VQPAPDVDEREEQAEPVSSTFATADFPDRYSGASAPLPAGTIRPLPKTEPLTAATPRQPEIDPLRVLVWGAFWVFVAAIWIVAIWLAVR